MTSQNLKSAFFITLTLWGGLSVVPSATAEPSAQASANHSVATGTDSAPDTSKECGEIIEQQRQKWRASGSLGLSIQLSSGHVEGVTPVRLLVKGLAPKGPGEEAGIRVGDVVTGVGDKEFPPTELGAEDMLRTLEAGEQGRVLVERNGKTKSVEITPARVSAEVLDSWVRHWALHVLPFAKMMECYPDTPHEIMGPDGRSMTLDEFQAEYGEQKTGGS